MVTLFYFLYIKVLILLSVIRDFIKQGESFGVFVYFMYSIPPCFICHPSDSIVPADAGFKLRAVAKLALAARRSNH